ncbi:hypothetical protein OAX11_04930 [Flavobacteriaceae bacterium]|nr:hypothetical protein [Flavobacteriaceae bacterium]
MKNQILYLLFLFTFIFSYGQDLKVNKYSDEFIKSCIIEVFQEHSDNLVFNNDSKRFEVLKEFMSRLLIEYRPKNIGEKMPSIYNFKLNNKYNKNLKYDDLYQKLSFNPLKYNFNMYPKVIKTFRIDNDYIISINPSN